MPTEVEQFDKLLIKITYMYLSCPNDDGEIK